MISPRLFNIYLSGISCPADDIEIIIYGFLASRPIIADSLFRLNNNLVDLTAFFDTKSRSTIFITWTAEMRLSLNVQVDGVLFPTTNYPKVLLHSHFQFATRSEVGTRFSSLMQAALGKLISIPC